MGKVSSFSITGLDLWFNSDDHKPPHFHAEQPGEWEVRVYFLRDGVSMFETKWTMRSGRPGRGDLKALVALVESNRGALLAEWEEKVHVTAPGGAR